MRILIIEDEAKLAGIIARSVRDEGFSADIAQDGERGLELAVAHEYDAIILDIMLPGRSGTDVLHAIRATNKQVPIIMLTARDAVADKVAHIDAGADDYLTKPFSCAELLVRIKAMLRRTSAQRDDTIRVGDLEIDRLLRQVRRAGKRIELSAKEYALLEYLALGADRVHSRAMIIEHVWDESFEGLTNIVDVYIRQLESLQAQQAPLGAQEQAAQYTIAVLLGEFPESMTQELSASGTIPALPPKLATGVPVELLRTRPDIRESERELAAATARAGVAEANLFPHVTLLGGAGYQQQALNISPSMTSFIWSVGPGIGLPILDFGALDAQVNTADLHTQELLASYKQKILTAVKQVDTASGTYSAQSDRLQHLNDALTASQQALSLATQRYDRGLTDMLNVIDAQRQEFDLEQQYILAQQTAAEQFIALYKALGSGWEKYQDIPPAPTPLPALIAALKHTAD